LILHRLTPELASENGQVGPQFGPQISTSVLSSSRKGLTSRRRFANSFAVKKKAATDRGCLPPN